MYKAAPCICACSESINYVFWACHWIDKHCIVVDRLYI